MSYILCITDELIDDLIENLKHKHNALLLDSYAIYLTIIVLILFSFVINTVEKLFTATYT